MYISEVFLDVNIYYEISNINDKLVYFIIDNGKPVYFKDNLDARAYISTKKLKKQKLAMKIYNKEH